MDIGVLAKNKKLTSHKATNGKQIYYDGNNLPPLFYDPNVESWTLVI